MATCDLNMQLVTYDYKFTFKSIYIVIRDTIVILLVSLRRQWNGDVQTIYAEIFSY